MNTLEPAPSRPAMTISALKAQKPINGHESLEKLEDWVIVYRYKTVECSKQQCKPERDCWNYHNPGDRRRVPVFDPETCWFNYFSKKCAITSWHSACGYAHNTFELGFHPLLYRTKLCLGNRTAGLCSIYGKYCGYAHESEELRTPALMYPLQSKLSKEEETWTKLPALPRTEPEGEPSALITADSLFSLHQVQGAYQAALRKIERQTEALRTKLCCQMCKLNMRVLLWSCCGRGICSACGQDSAGECPYCALPSQLIPLVL